MRLYALMVFLHVLAAVVWVGGMFVMHFAVRPVAVTQQDDTSAVIGEGVKAGERVVTSGFTRLSNGTRVRVQSGEDQPPVAAGEKQDSVPPEERPRKRDGAEKGEKGQKGDDNRQRRKKQDGSADSSRASTKQ